MAYPASAMDVHEHAFDGLAIGGFQGFGMGSSGRCHEMGSRSLRLCRGMWLLAEVFLLQLASDGTLALRPVHG